MGGNNSLCLGEGEGGVGRIQREDAKLFLSVTKTTGWTRQSMRCGRSGGKGILGAGKICTHA